MFVLMIMIMIVISLMGAKPNHNHKKMIDHFLMSIIMIVSMIVMITFLRIATRT